MSARHLALALAALLALPLAATRAEDPSPPAPPAPAPKPPGPSAAECAQCVRMVDELREEAARIRGLAWKFSVPADLISREQLREDFLAEMDAEYPPAKRQRDTALLRRQGLLGADQDVVAMLLDFYKAGVGGYYDPKKKVLRIVEGFAGEAQRPTILHELTHALEDQYIDLESRTKPFEDDGDRTFAEKCLGEGSAETARLLYEAAHPELAAVFRAGQSNEAMAVAQMEAFKKIPAYLFVGTLLHYRNGPAFVGQAVRGGSYPERMAALYNDPAVSQEQILHPERWFGGARDYPQAVVWGADLAATAGEGWTVFHQLPTGELDLALYLDFHLGPTKGKFNPMGVLPYAAARKAAAGWDAAWTTVLAKEGLPLLMATAYAFDSGEDAWEAAEMLEKAMERAAGGAWKSPGWVKPVEERAFTPAAATLDYVDAHGSGRLVLDRTHLLQVDGAPADVLARLWPVVVKTAFVRDARDTWTPEVDARALAALPFQDAAKGVALSPSAGWTAEAPKEPRTALVATIRHSGSDVTVLLSVEDRPHSTESALMRSMFGLQVEFPGLELDLREGEGIGGAPGLRMVLGTTREGRHAEQVYGFGWLRTLSARITAPTREALDKVRPELVLLLEAVRAKGL